MLLLLHVAFYTPLCNVKNTEKCLLAMKCLLCWLYIFPIEIMVFNIEISANGKQQTLLHLSDLSWYGSPVSLPFNARLMFTSHTTYTCQFYQQKYLTPARKRTASGWWCFLPRNLHWQNSLLFHSRQMKDNWRNNSRVLEGVYMGYSSKWWYIPVDEQ